MKDLKLKFVLEALDRATAPLRKVGEGFKGLEERAEHFKQRFEKFSLGGILGGGVILGGAIEAARGLYELTDKTAELGESYLHMAKRAGASVEEMQRLRFAAKQLGVDEDGLSQVFFRFQTHLANAIMGSKETRGALHQLGIPLKDLKKLSKDPYEAFLRLVDGFTSLKNPTQRAKIALDLFSRSGYQLLPMLTAGRAEILKFVAQIDDAHAVMSTEDAEASEEFIQNKNRMGLALQGLQMRIGVGLLPVMSKLIDKLGETVAKLQPAVVKRFTEAMGKMVDQLPQLLDLFSQLLEILAQVVPKFVDWTSKLGGLKTVLIAVAGIMAAEFLVNLVKLTGAIWGLIEATGALKILAIGQAAIQAAVGLMTLIPLINSTTTAMAALDVVMDANPIGLIALAILAIVAAVALLAFGAYELIKHWKPVTAFFSGLCEGIAGFFEGLWKRVTDGMPAWLKTGLKIGGIAAALAINPVLGGAALAASSLASPAKAPAAAPPARADVHVHVTSEGHVQVKKVASSSPHTTVSVHRGHLPD